LGHAKWAEPNLFYAPLHDYQLDPPDLSPDIQARSRLIEGRTAILAQTPIAQHTNVLSGIAARVATNDDWFAYVGRVVGSTTDDVITLHRRGYEDHRVSVFEFWWASTAGREDQELVESLYFLSCHKMATRGCVGFLTSTDDPAVAQQYSSDQPVVRSPWDRLVELSRTDMVLA
jgi:hypothetical protein